MVELPDFLAGEIAVSGDYWHFSRTPVSIGATPYYDDIPGRATLSFRFSTRAHRSDAG